MSKKLKVKALQKKLITEDKAVHMTDEAAINLIFYPGFSTAEVATDSQAGVLVWMW